MCARRTDYPLRHAAALLADLKSTFASKADKGLNLKLAGGLNGDMQPKLSKLAARYDDLSNVDQIHATLGKVEAVKVVMQDSIELALQNCVSLESIDAKADELQSQAGMFKTRAKKLRSQMCASPRPRTERRASPPTAARARARPQVVEEVQDAAPHHLHHPCHPRLHHHPLRPLFQEGQEERRRQEVRRPPPLPTGAPPSSSSTSPRPF